RDAAHVGIRHARHRSPQTQRPTVGGHPSKGNPTLAVRGQLDDRTGSTVSRLSCVLHESTRTSSFLVQDFVRTPDGEIPTDSQGNAALRPEVGRARPQAPDTTENNTKSQTGPVPVPEDRPFPPRAEAAERSRRARPRRRVTPPDAESDVGDKTMYTSSHPTR